MLKKYAAQVTENPKRLEKLYKIVFLGALNPPEALSTYHIPKGFSLRLASTTYFEAALQMVEEHAPIFKKYMTLHAEKIFSYIKTYCIHKNKKVRFRAYPALEAFYLHVSLELVSGTVSQERSRDVFKVNSSGKSVPISLCLQFFMKEFWTGLDVKKADIEDVSVCIRGFGFFASSARTFMGIFSICSIAWSGNVRSCGGKEDASSFVFIQRALLHF